MEMGAKEAVLALLRELIRQVQSIDEDRLSAVVAGKAKLEVRVVPKQRPSALPKQSWPGAEELRHFGGGLRALRTPEEGNQVLGRKTACRGDKALFRRHGRSS